MEEVGTYASLVDKGVNNYIMTVHIYTLMH